MAKIQLSQSLNRPAWIQYDLGAFNHKYINGKVIKNYFKKIKGDRR